MSDMFKRPKTFLLFFLFRKNKIEQNGKKEDYSNAVLGKDCLDNLGEDGKEACCLSEAQADTERKADDNHVALREARLCQHAEASEEDAAEHHDGAAAKHRLGNGGKYGANGREQTSDDHDGGSDGDGRAVDDLRHCSETHILRERGDRSAAEQSCYSAHESVTGYRRPHLSFVHVSAKGS